MAKRCIGIDFDEGTLRLALAESDKGQARLIRAMERSGVAPEELAGVVTEFLGSPPVFGDRMALGLAARSALVRRLEFPFSDPAKIRAGLELEMAARLPIGLDDHVTDAQAPVPGGARGFMVNAAAVRKTELAALLETLDRSGLPVQVVDVKPFALAAGLRPSVQDAVLGCLEEKENFLVLIRNGRLEGLRMLPAGSPDAATLARNSMLLQKGTSDGQLPLVLVGRGATAALRTRLKEQGCESLGVELGSETGPVTPSCVPAAALALRAALPSRGSELNFRKGPFALKGEWAALKRQFIIAAVLLILTLVTAATGAWLNYSGKSRQAEALQQQLTQVFTSTFPGTKPIADIALQMRSKIKELEQKSLLLGAGGEISALSVLKEVSARAPGEVRVDLREFAYTDENLVLDGSTTTFDAVNQLARSLEQSPILSSVKVADAKMSLDGARVDFRLTLNFESGEPKP